MNESDAKAALRAMGIRNPSRQLVDDYMRLQQAQEWALEVPERSSVELAGERSQTAPMEASQGYAGPDSTDLEAQEPQSNWPLPNSAPERSGGQKSSKSNLAPLLRQRGDLVRTRGPRKRGRPRVEAAFFPRLALLMSDGLSLPFALAAVGVRGLSKAQLRSLYRSTQLRAMREEARQKHDREWGVRHRKPARRACKGGDRLGMDWKLRRIL
jgi:hypothetical protein